MIKIIFRYIHIIWLSVILLSLHISPELLLIAISYFLAPFFYLVSLISPEITIFRGTNLSIWKWEMILLILILLSSIILISKLISKIIKKLKA